MCAWAGNLHDGAALVASRSGDFLALIGGLDVSGGRHVENCLK